MFFIPTKVMDFLDWSAPNNLDLMAFAEMFLAEHLSGHYEPMNGNRIRDSTAIVKVVGN